VPVKVLVEVSRLKLEFERLLLGVELTDRKVFAVCLSFGFLVRLIPELLAFPLPIGFDTVYYASVMKGGVIWPHWSTFFTSTWLLYAFVVPLYSLFHTDPFLLLKIVVPILYGMNVGGVYWFARKMLGWGWRMSLVAGVFFAVQLASLRISWDLLRNTLGLGLLLFTMPLVKKINSKRGFAIFTAFSLLTVFAHEYSAAILLTTVIGLVVWRLVKKRVDLESKSLLLATIPALSVFLIGIFLRIFPVYYEVQSNIINAGDAVNGGHGGLFFLVDYLHVRSSVDYYSTYWSLAFSVVVLFAVLFLPYLALVVKGFFRNGVLNFWTVLLLIGSFDCLVVPFFALEYWHRWMFMLVYPFTFYAVNGLKGLSRRLQRTRTSFSWFVGKKASAMVFLTFFLGVAYLATPLLMVYASVTVPSVSGTYLYFSTSPTVPYEDVTGVVRAMRWLDAHMNVSSCVVLQHAFLSWGQLYLDKSREIVHFETSVDMALNTALGYGFSRVYFVWWNQPIRWYGISVPAHFVSLHDFGRISVYVYGG
jgi:hypothetical protein